METQIEKKDLIFNNVKKLEKDNILTSDTKQYFMDHQLDQGDDKYWRYGVLRNYDNLYIGIIPKKNNIKNKNLRKDVFDQNYDCSLIVSYMVIIKEWGKEFRLIELLDTFYCSNNLGFRMIEKYMKQYNKKVIPYHIIPSSVDYWKKFMDKIYNIKTKEDYTQFIEKNNLLKYKNIISWNYLLETL